MASDLTASKYLTFSTTNPKDNDKLDRVRNEQCHEMDARNFQQQ